MHPGALTAPHWQKNLKQIPTCNGKRLHCIWGFFHSVEFCCASQIEVSGGQKSPRATTSHCLMVVCGVTQWGHCASIARALLLPLPCAWPRSQIHKERECAHGKGKLGTTCPGVMQSQRGREQGMSRGIPGLDPITTECSPAPHHWETLFNPVLVPGMESGAQLKVTFTHFPSASCFFVPYFF